MKTLRIFNIVLLFVISCFISESKCQSYKIVDTGQEECYDTLNIISPPIQGEAFYGQDAQFDGVQFSFQDNNNGTVTDLNTGLIWQNFLFEDKYSYNEALALADTFSFNGYDDWRLPSIKELYSLIDFRGVTGMSEEESIPYIDTNYFEFRYGIESLGERFIDAQYISSTEYVGTTMNDDFTVFGVNFADGRIKGYPGAETPMGEKLFEVKLVRGNPDYGINNFTDNGDGTITDEATGLMWSKSDNGEAVKWEDALSWVYQKNQENYLGYNNWRLPNAKELQSIVDYKRSPQTTNSAAIDSMFEVTQIIDEGEETNYPFYWTGTTHADGNPDNLYLKAVYIAFGEALGFMEAPPNSGNYILMDVHGAGAQRSDPKFGDPDEFPYGFGPQGDVIRIFNFVRLVRGGLVSEVESKKSSLPGNYNLEQNYPNPFNPVTTIKFTIPTPFQRKAGSPVQTEEREGSNFITLKIYDTLGREVTTLVNEEKSPGKYEIKWNAKNQSSGIYFYQLKTNSSIETKKMVLLR